MHFRTLFRNVIGVAKHSLRDPLPEEVQLTFDDGPNLETTPLLLDELDKAGVKATFFVIGKKLESSLGQDLLNSMRRRGHMIGNHTYSHPNLVRLAEAQIEHEILRTEQLIGPDCAKILRPPYGCFDSRVKAVALSMGYHLMLWNVDSLDWKATYRHGQWIDHAIGQLGFRRTSIVLNHENHLGTAQNILRFVTAVRANHAVRFTQPAMIVAADKH